MGEVPGNPGHPKMWRLLIERKKREPDQLLTARDFDPILEKYPGGISDFPASIFGVDMIHAYPLAKVLITTREEDGWIDSMMRTLIPFHREREEKHQARIRRGELVDEVDEERYRLGQAYHDFGWNDDFPTYGRAYWKKYQDAVRTTAAKNRSEEDVLVYSASEGWEPLCKFLGLDVPSDLPFPHEGKNAVWAGERANEAA